MAGVGGGGTGTGLIDRELFTPTNTMVSGWDERYVFRVKTQTYHRKGAGRWWVGHFAEKGGQHSHYLPVIHGCVVVADRELVLPRYGDHETLAVAGACLAVEEDS